MMSAREELNIDWNAAASAENGATIATGRDSEYTATFYLGKVPNFEGTDYKEVPHLRLQIPGNRLWTYDQPAQLEGFADRPSDPARFPRAWAAFKRGENLNGTGTPLEDWDAISVGDIRRLDMLGIQTIEQLAIVADAHLDGLGFGGRMIRDRARQYVEGRGRPDPEKEVLKAQLAEQSGKIGKLTDIVASLLERLGEDALITAPDPAPAEPEARAPRRARAQQEA